jgi:tripeptide aminopeptidase
LEDFMINKERLVETFMEYVKIDSETKNEKAISERVARDLTDLGFNVYVDSAGAKADSNGNNVYCFLEGTKNLEPILFSAHMDTVTPGIGIEPYIDGEYIKSKGDTILGGDDKSGVVAIIEALRIIKENNLPHGPIEVIFSICEEGGLLGAKYAELDRIKSKRAVILDSGSSPGKIVIQAPGQNNIHAKVFGKPSHAGGNPENGISAIMVLAEAVTNMKLLRIDYETTANIGTFKAVGVTNIVSAYAEFIAEARSRSNEKLKIQTDHMIDCLENAAKKHGARVEYEVTEKYSSYSLDSDDELVEMAGNICKNIGIAVEKVASGGGSDANIYNKKGIKTINLGTGMDLVHTTDERLCIEEFVAVAKVVLGIMTR